MTKWQDILSRIREGKDCIPTDDEGIPLVGARAALYELMELMEALTTGYNYLVARGTDDKQRIERIRKIARAAFPGCNSPADGWISVDDMLPPKSGEYFTYGSNLGVYPLAYSAKHLLWNAHDSDTPESALAHAFTEITHWYPQPLPPVNAPASEEDSE